MAYEAAIIMKISMFRVLRPVSPLGIPLNGWFSRRVSMPGFEPIPLRVFKISSQIRYPQSYHKGLLSRSESIDVVETNIYLLNHQNSVTISHPRPDILKK